jgi:hypothetical protein
MNPDLIGRQGPNDTIIPPWFADPNNPNRILPNGGGGSGQPINQPMVPGSGLGGTWTPQDAARFTQNSGPMPASGGGFISQPMGSLQSLGGGQLNQSGMVTLRAPDGSQTKAVPADQVAHWLSRGAVRV